MAKLNCWTVVLVAILFMPNLAASADPATEACRKGEKVKAKEDFAQAKKLGYSGPVADPPRAKNGSLLNGSDPLAKDIKREVAGLGYSDKVAQEFLAMVGDWDLAVMKQKLVHAREDYRQGKLSKLQLARKEMDAAERLVGRIRENVGSLSHNYDLADVIRDRKANCLGNSQLFCVLGSSFGLPVKVMVVFQPAHGQYPPGITHAACLVDLTDGRAIMVDATGFGSFWAELFGADLVSQPFVFTETFGTMGNVFEIKNGTNPLGLHRRIQVMDTRGLLGAVYYNRGCSDGQKGDLNKAIADYSEAIRLNPKYADAYWGRGSAYDRKGGLDKAIADYSEAIRLDPKLTEAYCDRGTVDLKKHDPDKAIADYTEAIRLNPKWAEVYSNRGSAYETKGDHDKAIADCTEAIRLDPKYTDAYLRRGRAYGEKREFEKAIADDTAAIRLNPKYPLAYNNRGWAYGEKGDYDKAIADYSEAIRLDPKYTDAYLRRGGAYGEKGDHDKAITDYTNAIRLNPKYALAYCNRGSAYERKGNLEKAIADYSEAIRLDPKLAEVYWGRGFRYGNKGDFDKAIADYTQAIRLNPKLVEAYWGRGSAYGNKGDTDKAIADYTQAIRWNPKLAELYGKRGWAYGVKGDFGKAIADYSEALRLDPKTAGVHNNLAWLLATCPEKRFRDGPRAIDHATRACELTKWNDSDWLDTLAAAHAEAGKFDKAVEFQQKALALAAKDAEKDSLRERLKLYRDRKPYREPVKKK